MWNPRFALTLVALCAFTLVRGQQPDLKVLEGMKWRSIGPYRAGRSIAVAGSQARPNEYYFGATGGGVWKTSDGGVNWTCVSDGFFRTSSVGAVAVAESNPDVVYAGMGESCIRGNIASGDGVYKTSDGGKTWTHMGLAETQTISRIRVHPKNADIVWVAALGHVYGPNPERGVFKSSDGGKTWRRTLYVSDRAGAVDVSVDPSDPNVLFAATWEAWRTPYTMNSGGPGSRLFKSTDGGETWTDITRQPGIPTGVLGKIGVAVSPANPKRVYACIEALEGGVFRSDDGGATWERTSDNRNYRQRAWYYTHIVADPKDADTVYVLNVGFGKSTDGGKTFSGVRTPHSDNHDLWIAPDNSQRMINANDGGANVTTDGGRTWTEQDVPTGQFYHVTTDNAFPYRIYGAQQDNSTVRIASRTNGPGIGRGDWTGTAGGESGYIAVKPDDPDVVYGGSYGGDLTMLNHRTGETRSVDPWPDNPMGWGAESLEHRFQWTFPIVFSPNDSNTLYTASQFLLKTTNGGRTWVKISPDLTRNDKSRQGPSGGPITKDNTSVEYYCTIFTVAESPKRAGVIWCGSDDGLVHVTQNGGRSWANVTPKDMPEWGLCSMVEASPHDPATAYLAVDNHENDDHAPYAYRTRDYGKTWTKIVAGIPSGAFLRVVREDPAVRGLLYAGTETGVFVSFNDGDSWKPLQWNLPVCPVHDLAIKDSDLIAATHGRGFWVLDDLSPVRQAAKARPNEPYLFQPRDTYLRGGVGGGFGGGGRRGQQEAQQELLGQNPPSGIVVSYYLPQNVNELTFEFKDSSGVVLLTRQGTSEDRTAGFHRITANLQYPSYRSVQGMIYWAAGPRPIPAPPGTYRVRMIAGEATQEQSFKLVPNPLFPATAEDLVAQFELARRIAARTNEANDAVLRIRSLKSGIDAALADPKATDLKTQGEAVQSALSAVEEEIYQVRNRSGQDPLNYPIKLNNKLAALLGVVLSGSARPTDQSYEVFDRLSKQLEAQLSKLRSIEAKDLLELNRHLQAVGVKPVTPTTPGSGGGRT